MNWKTIVGTVAPSLATALGGPLAGVATKAIAEKLLGKPDATSADVAAAVAGASPEQLQKLHELDLQFEKDMAALGIDLERLAAEDRASARAMQIQTRSRVPSIMAIGVTAGFFGLIGVMCATTVPSENRTMLDILMGALGTAWITIITFYFGSSRSSQVKDETIAGAVGSGKA